MSAEAGPGGFDTIVSRPDYYIEFLDARTAIDDETRVKQVITGLLQARDGVEVLDVGTGTRANRLGAMVDAGETTAEEANNFWAELEQGEREGWLCSGIVCFNVVGRKAA
jgi:hypothetical protein